MSQSSRAARRPSQLKSNFRGRIEEERIDLAQRERERERERESLARKPLRSRANRILGSLKSSRRLSFFSSPFAMHGCSTCRPRLFLRDNELQGRVVYHITSGSRFPRLARLRDTHFYRPSPPSPAIKKISRNSRETNSPPSLDLGELCRNLCDLIETSALIQS